MGPLGGARFRPRERLKSASAFRTAFRRGVRLDGPLFLLVAARNGHDYARLGIAASRRVGGAVERNRAKRLLRESFRRNKGLGEEGYDLVLVAKRELAESGLAEVEHEYRKRLRRLAQERGGPRAPRRN